MTVEELYQLVLDGLSEGNSLDQIARTNNLKIGDWVHLVRHAVYMEGQCKQLVTAINDVDRVNEMKQLFDLPQNETSDKDLELIQKNLEHQIVLIQKIKAYFSLYLGNLADVAQAFNQFYAEARLAGGNKAPDITSISYAAAEGLSTTMSDGQFYSSEQDKSPLRISGNPALLSSKHNACPLVIGVNAAGTKSLAWHIPYSSLDGPTASKKLSAPRQSDKVVGEETIYIALGLSEGLSHKLPDGIKPTKYYSLPPGIKIETFVLRGEPASYDTSYYPKSDTLIVWGKNTSGAICAWQMSNAVLGSGQGAWKKAVLGTTEDPMLYWQQFLSEHYSTVKSPDELKSEDALMSAFIKYLDKEHEDATQEPTPRLPITKKILSFHAPVQHTVEVNKDLAQELEALIETLKSSPPKTAEKSAELTSHILTMLAKADDQQKKALATIIISTDHSVLSKLDLHYTSEDQRKGLLSPAADIITQANSILGFKHNVKFEETDDGLKITFDLGQYRRPDAPRFIEATLAKDGTFTLPVDQYWQDTSIADKPLIVKVGGDGMFNNFNDVLNSTRAFPGGDAQFHLLHKELAKFCEKHNIEQPKRKSLEL